MPEKFGKMETELLLNTLSDVQIILLKNIRITTHKQQQKINKHPYHFVVVVVVNELYQSKLLIKQKKIKFDLHLPGCALSYQATNLLSTCIFLITRTISILWKSALKKNID